MKFGIAIDFNPSTDGKAWEERYKSAIDMGYDYIEANAGQIAKMSLDEINSAKIRLAGISILAANCLFPGEMPVVGINRDQAQISEYLDGTLKNCSLLGIKKVVFGSGWSRRIDGGYPYEKAHQDMRSTCKIASDTASKYNIIIAVEPLNRGECNFINTVSQGLALVKELDLENIRLLADLYHVYQSGGDFSIKKEDIKYFSHFHCARPQDRTLLTEVTAECLNFAKTIREAGYDDTVTTECVLENFDRGGIANLKVLREIFVCPHSCKKSLTI